MIAQTITNVPVMKQRNIRQHMVIRSLQITDKRPIAVNSTTKGIDKCNVKPDI